MVNTPSKAEAQATAEPTLTSMSPAMIMKVMPQAMMPLNATARSTFSRLREVRKLGANSARATNKSNRAIRRPERASNSLVLSLRVGELL